MPVPVQMRFTGIVGLDPQLSSNRYHVVIQNARHGGHDGHDGHDQHPMGREGEAQEPIPEHFAWVILPKSPKVTKPTG